MVDLRSAGAPLRRVAMLSLHTSPLAPAGTGDAGGMNVYIDAVARGIARRGVEVDVFTRATPDTGAATIEAAPGYAVHHLAAGGGKVAKDALPAHVGAFARELLRREERHPSGRFDIVHSHYWLSGQAGWAAANSWGVPWVHSMHTLARVKNAARAAHDRPEPAARIAGEDRIVRASDLLVANTAAEAEDLRRLYAGDGERISVVHPGVDLDCFVPGDRGAARRALGVPAEATLLLFVGRLQPLKAPDVLIRALATMVQHRPGLRREVLLVVCGGPSGSLPMGVDTLASLAGDLGVADLVRFEPPVARHVLAQWYRAADLTVVPSHNESFGLVAVESQAAGTPVAAAAVGGLRTAVADGRGGVLIDGHDQHRWAQVLGELVADPARRERLGIGGRRHALRFSWDATVDGLLAGYQSVAAGLAVAAHAAAG